MKKNFVKKAARIVFPALMLSVLITACNNDDYSQQEHTDPSHVDHAPVDSELTRHTDTMMMDKTHVAPMDSSDKTLPVRPDSIR